LAVRNLDSVDSTVDDRRRAKQTPFWQLVKRKAQVYDLGLPL